jgi:glycosyltransferase involved in cell wall biosynthesis
VPVKNARLFDEVLARLRRDVPSVVGVSLERLARSKVAEMMRASDAVLLTSLSEGSPVAVREALATGTPVVSVDVGDVPEVLAGLPGCSVRSRDPAALAEGIKLAFAMTDPDPLFRRAALYDRKLVAQHLVRIYEGLCARG